MTRATTASAASVTGRVARFAWGLLIGALLGACGLIWIELHSVHVGLTRSLGLALIVLAICSTDREE